MHDLEATGATVRLLASLTDSIVAAHNALHFALHNTTLELSKEQAHKTHTKNPQNSRKTHKKSDK